MKVPMAGPDGTQTLQTINVPRYLYAYVGILSL